MIYVHKTLTRYNWSSYILKDLSKTNQERLKKYVAVAVVSWFLMELMLSRHQLGLNVSRETCLIFAAVGATCVAISDWAADGIPYCIKAIQNFLKKRKDYKDDDNSSSS